MKRDIERLRFNCFLFLVIAACGSWNSSASAQDTPGWKHQATLYFIGAGLNGGVTMKGVSADVEMSFGDILENLDFSFMAAYRMQKDRWSLGTDVIYLGMGTTGEQERFELTVDQWMVELNGGYEVRPFFTLIAGLRYNSLANRLFYPGENELEAIENWVDPLAGGRFSWPFASAWSLHLRGDVGGFGVGSDFAWQLMPILEWMPSERLSTLLAYRIIDTDYENEDIEFKYDMTVTGPSLGVAARF